MRATFQDRNSKLKQLALRETDPRHYSQFQPVNRGPIVGLVLLAALALTVPFYYLGRLLAGARQVVNDNDSAI